MDSIFAYEHPYVCTDAAVFTLKTGETASYRKLPTTKLALLLYKRSEEPFKNKWCLPGGFLNIDERPEDTIKRKLSDKARVDNCYLEQLYTFCDIDRDPRARVISITYLGLMKEVESHQMRSSQWFEISTSQKLLQFTNLDNQLNLDTQLTLDDFGFDHYGIIQMALERLRSKILYSDLVFNLLPDQFTLTQMQTIYETILDKKETTPNFRRKIADLVQETDYSTSDMGHRPAKLFTKRSPL